MNLKIISLITLCLNILANNNIYLFDLHGVILQRSIKQGASAFYNMPKKKKFLKKLFGYFKNGTIQKKDKWQSIEFATDAKENPEIYPVINCHYLDKKVSEIIYDLKKSGYRIGLFSNIGQDSLDWLAQQDPEIASLLKEFDFIWTSGENNDYARKSESKAYIDCKNKLVEQFGPNIKPILIDDSWSKLKLAFKNGFNTYYFKSSKKFKRDITLL